jgi:small subunit ribosomal protein S21
LTKPIQVEVTDGNIEKALKDLKKKMAFEGVYKEIKRRRFYEKPSVEKKRKREESARRLKKRERRMQARFKSRRPAESGRQR